MSNNYDNSIFLSIKNSLFRDNYWLYNVYLIFNILFISLYIKRLIEKQHFKKALSITYIMFFLFSIGYWIYTNSFMYSASMYNFIFGCFVVILGVAMYYYEVINSDEILNFYSNINFYLLSILLAWHIITAPLFIFGSFYNVDNPKFVEFRRVVLLISNIIMYLSFTICFMSFYYKKKYWVKSK